MCQARRITCLKRNREIKKSKTTLYLKACHIKVIKDCLLHNEWKIVHEYLPAEYQEHSHDIDFTPISRIPSIYQHTLAAQETTYNSFTSPRPYSRASLQKELQDPISEHFSSFTIKHPPMKFKLSSRLAQIAMPKINTAIPLLLRQLD